VVAIGLVIGCASAPRAPATPFVTPPTASWTHGAIYGVVTSLARGEHLVGVTVTVTSPSLGGQAHSALSDERGGFSIDELPAGEYVVTFFYLEIVLKRRLLVRLHEPARVTVVIDESRSKGERIEVTGSSHCHGEWPDWRMNHLAQPTISCSMDCRHATGICADLCWSRGR